MRYISHQSLLFLIIASLLISTSSKFVYAAEKKRTLTVSLLIFSAEQRNAFERVSTLFSKRHPNIHIKYVSQNDIDYKKNYRSWLESSENIDVLSWPWVGRFEEYVEREQIEPISDLWQKESMNRDYSQLAKNLVTVNKQQYAIPYSAGFWGFYYRDSLFKKLEILPPKSWQDFLNVCQKFKDIGITPIAIGIKQPWPAVGWFDYLNLRINGLKFHQDLINGRISFNSTSIYSVFMHWKKLIDSGFFDADIDKVNFKQTIPLLYRNKAGMILSGNYVTTQFPPHIRDDFKFFRFPIINPQVELAEETPTDVFLIPKNSKNKELARKFLAFISEPEPQMLINNTINFLPVNQSADISSNYFLNSGREMLSQAKGYSQYFDREAPSKFVQKVLPVLAEFMIDSDIEKAQRNLELIRKQLF